MVKRVHNCKPWYKSKTMWVNLIMGAIFFTEGAGQLVSGFSSLLGEYAMPVSFALAIVNLGLRSITNTGVTK